MEEAAQARACPLASGGTACEEMWPEALAQGLSPCVASWACRVSAACPRGLPGVRPEAEDTPAAAAVAFSEACGAPGKLSLATAHAGKGSGALARGLNPVLPELHAPGKEKRPD